MKRERVMGVARTVFSVSALSLACIELWSISLNSFARLSLMARAGAAGVCVWGGGGGSSEGKVDAQQYVYKHVYSCHSDQCLYTVVMVTNACIQLSW